MKIKCPAKINLFLNVLGLKGSMHELLLINQTVNLYDEIELIITNNNQIVIESKENIPKDETTLYTYIIEESRIMTTGLAGGHD